jgi:cyclic pyranopterin phosphate synthase
LSLITNGLLLEREARPLAEAGLRRLTVSLDSLDAERFRRITRGGELARVFKGLEAARRAGLGPLKINCVMLRDNQDELLRLAALAMEQPWDIRFIEYMPVTAGLADPLAPDITPALLRDAIEKKWGKLADDHDSDSAPARSYRLKGGLGRIGFISSVSRPFCAQ